MTENVKLMHRTIGDLSKQPGNIPTGTWELRAIKISAKEVTKTTRDGEEYETSEYTLSLEPISAGAGVDPQALAEVDERTGKPVYDGKRLFLRYVDAFRSDMSQLAAAFRAMGFEPDADFDEIVERNLVKGRKVFGEIWNREFTRNDGTPGTEQKVRSWASSEASSAFAL